MGIRVLAVEYIRTDDGTDIVVSKDGAQIRLAIDDALLVARLIKNAVAAEQERNAAASKAA